MKVSPENGTPLIRKMLSSSVLRHVVLLVALGSIYGCTRNGGGAGSVQQTAVPVVVAEVLQKTIPVQLSTFGTVEAYYTVAVKAQVTGVLQKVHFTEGQNVRRGDLLFTIDPRPFETALHQAEANLARDKVQAENAEREANRQEYLLKKGVATQEAYDNSRAAANALSAAVRADAAAVENAKVQLDYCTIRSPISGRTGKLLIDEGNLIKANDTPALVTINQMAPINLTFSVPETELPAIRKYMSQEKLEVQATIPGDEEAPMDGTLTLVDNAVDYTTGTVRLKATFENGDERLWPGQFAGVVLTLTTQPNAIVVPSQAIQTGQEGQYVFVVKPDLIVEARPVIVGRTVKNETVVEKGLQAGELVVTDGQLRLVPGTKVEVTNKPETSEMTYR